MIDERPRGICTLPLERLRRDGGTQLRERMSGEVMVEYAEAIGRGDEFPPVVVFDDGESLWLADGFHRYDAHKMQRRDEMLCEIKEGCRKDAILYSAKANRTHGFRETQADREKKVATLVLEFPEATQQDLASMCDMTQRGVGKILDRLGLNKNSSNPGPGRPRKEEPILEPTPIEAALAEVPEEQRKAIEELLTAPMVPPDRALEAAQNVAEMPEEQRERVAELAASTDETDRSAAVAMMRGNVYVDPAWPLVNVALDDLKKGLRMHRGKPAEGAFKVCIQHVEGLLEVIATDERRKTDVAA